jgi:hypothetical protein
MDQEEDIGGNNRDDAAEGTWAAPTWEAPKIPEIRPLSDLRKKPFKRRAWEVQSLQDRHHEVIRRLLIGQDCPAIAEEMGLSVMAVSGIKNSPLIRQKLDVLQGARDLVAVDVSKRIKDLAPKAVELLESIIEGRDGGEAAPLALRAKVAMDNLDRSGYPRQTHLKTENLHAFLSKDDILEVKQRALERRALVNVVNEG